MKGMNEFSLKMSIKNFTFLINLYFRKKIRAKEIIADGFTDSFQLKPEEIMILRGSGSATSNLSDEIDERFFTILDKVKRIHQDSKILLMSNQQTTG